VDSVSGAVLPSNRACHDHNLAQPDSEKECYVRDCLGDPSLEYPNHGGMNDMGKDPSNAGYMWRTGRWGEVRYICQYALDAFMTISECSHKLCLAICHRVLQPALNPCGSSSDKT
jgi:hypothetical protein